MIRVPRHNCVGLSTEERVVVELVGGGAEPARCEELLQRHGGSEALWACASRQCQTARFLSRLDATSDATRALWHCHRAAFQAARWAARAQVLKRRCQAGFALRVLAEQGLQAIPIKGLVVAEHTYESEDHREAGDLDILVATDFDNALKALEAAGAVRAFSEPAAQRFERQQGHQVLLLPPFAMPMHLELHWRVFADLDESCVQDISSHATAGTCAGQPAQLPSHEDHLLLCAHHVVASPAHGNASLRWWLDLDLMLRARPTNWNLALQRSVAWGSPLTFGLGVAGAVQLFDTPVPVGFWDELYDNLLPTERRAFAHALGAGVLAMDRDVVLAALWKCRRTGYRSRSMGGLVWLPRAAIARKTGLDNKATTFAQLDTAARRLWRIVRAGAVHARLWVDSSIVDADGFPRW